MPCARRSRNLPARHHRVPAVSLRVPALLLACCAAAASAEPLGLQHPVDADAIRLGPGWLSTDANDYNLSTDDGEQLLVFGRSSKGDFHDAHIRVSRRTGHGWTEPVPAAFTDARWRDSDPWLTPDRRWLYFVSNRPAPGRDPARDDLDLWRAPVTGTGFGPLQHLAEASSPGEELGPELHAGSLTFNSTRTGGPAALALYASPLIDGTPGVAVPLPAPFNDGRAQGDLTFSPDGGSALFWSIRGDSREPDLFLVRRAGTGWSAAIRLPAPFNAPGMDFTPAWSADGKALRWASQRGADSGTQGGPRNADIYAAAASGLDAVAPP